jgi:hypothetical protein
MFAPMRDSIAGKHREFWFYAASNWNAACWNGATGAALTVLPDRNDRALFAAAAELYSNGYLASYTDSGYAEEGIAYWSYGFSNYEQLREQLWLSTHGEIDLYDNPKARKSALFPFQFQMLPGVYADFGDARFMTEPDPVLMAGIDQIFGLGIMKLDDQSMGIRGDIRGSLPQAMLRAFLVPSERKSEGEGSEYNTLIGRRTYYPDAGVLVSRPAAGGGLALTVKADGNGGHSHNDIGSYSIGLGTTQPVGDPGGPLFYTSKTFGARRFDSPLLNSFAHPVPTVDGHLQLEATKVSAPCSPPNSRLSKTGELQTAFEQFGLASILDESRLQELSDFMQRNKQFQKPLRSYQTAWRQALDEELQQRDIQLREDVLSKEIHLTAEPFTLPSFSDGSVSLESFKGEAASVGVLGELVFVL